MAFVLDCSVALTWILPDEDDERADRVLDRLLHDSAIVPELWSLEVANVLLIAQRRSGIDGDEIGKALQELRALPIEFDKRTHENAFTETFELASAYNLTAYDAAYLELAKRRALPLATLDRRLRAACSAVEIDVL